MLKKMMSIVPVAALSLTVGATAQAATVTVQKGDTLWDLAQENNTTVENIQSVNHLTTDLIHPGDFLTIPRQNEYGVRSGDTLWDIARHHGVTVSQIKEWNQLHSDLIHPGDILTIAQEYFVENGDTLWDIARNHGVTVSQLKEWNALNSDIIHPGLNLVIFKGGESHHSSSQVPQENPVEEKAPVTEEKVATESASEPAAPSTNEEVVTESTEETAPVTNEEVPAENTTEETTPATTEETSTESKEEAAPATNEEDPAENTTEETAPVADETTTSEEAPKEFIMEATAYTATCEGCSGITATGINLLENPDLKVISVDPELIPLGSKVYVEGYGEAIAGDTGGAIKGNRIDVFIPNKQDAIDYGVQTVKVTILD
ncbi:LysM peptidoglycan-binding domain-containing protein [Ureibacillus sp. 179-F W5.1 NHS]|uniref:LysM peptidoglycan-binding domain-containing protein n=1 Tax=Ureibacillus sp. 179-F W5.1 NHS TaxID=3374297 RepID=UPI00387A3F3B